MTVESGFLVGFNRISLSRRGFESPAGLDVNTIAGEPASRRVGQCFSINSLANPGATGWVDCLDP